MTHSLLRSNANVSTFALFTFGIALREFFRKCSDSLFVFWVPLNILSSSQYPLSIPIFLSCTARVQKCHAHRFVSYNSVPPGHCCPIVNIRGHPPPARFPKQIFQLLLHRRNRNRYQNGHTALLSAENICLEKSLIFIIVVSLAQILVAAGCLTNSDWATNMWMEPRFTIHPLCIVTNDEWWG